MVLLVCNRYPGFDTFTSGFSKSLDEEPIPFVVIYPSMLGQVFRNLLKISVILPQCNPVEYSLFSIIPDYILEIPDCIQAFPIPSGIQSTYCCFEYSPLHPLSLSVVIYVRWTLYVKRWVPDSVLVYVI